MNEIEDRDLYIRMINQGNLMEIAIERKLQTEGLKPPSQRWMAVA
jgi:hypothetical protein